MVRTTSYTNMRETQEELQVPVHCNVLKSPYSFLPPHFFKRSMCLIVFTFDIIHVVYGHKPISALEFDGDCNND